MYVNIALNIPSDKLFTYEVPLALSNQIAIGKRVFVPFGRRKRTGFIVSTLNYCPLKNIKLITEVLDEEPLFDEHDLNFYQWVADYFMYPLGKTLAEIIPAGVEKKDFLWITPLPTTDDTSLTPSQNKLMEILRQYPRGIAQSNLTKLSALKNISVTIRNLKLAGYLNIEERQKNQLAPQQEKFVLLDESKIAEIKLTRRQEELISFLQSKGPIALTEVISQSGTSSAIIKKLQEKGIINFSATEKIRTATIESLLEHVKTEINLNAEQKKALCEISSQINKKVFSPILLHGITGSGKTEVYLHAIEKVLADGGSAIYLVPEIALTPQLISRIQGRFNHGQIAILHSGIAETVRYDQWRQIKRGIIKLVIGARSALFAPLADLRLIIVDEEHDASYKQDERLCYHARDLAVVKAKKDKAIVILGSATPGIRSYYNAQTNKYRYLELAQRVEDKPLPQVEIIDMKALKEMQGKAPILSDALIAAMEMALANKEQILLFLNKRGFDTFLVCADCGYNFRCPNCAVSLKNHAAEGIIKCHYCGFEQKVLPICPNCRGAHIFSYGVGTQKLEAEARKLFPEARVQRMDSDTTSPKGAQEKILQKLGLREINILVGTQMITKGHDFPFITLVGVITADTILNMPDFRATERTFQQLTQVAGRGGRGDAPGRVIIQTFNPQHYALQHVKKHDYKSFYEEEISFRRDLHYPPFGRIINLRLSSANKDSLLEQVKLLEKSAKKLNEKQGYGVEIIGPAESPLAKLKGRWRWQMLLKGQNSKALHQLAQELMRIMEKSTVKITVDVDPENFL